MDVRAFVCSASLPAELRSGARDPGRLGATGSRLRWRVFSTYGWRSRSVMCLGKARVEGHLSMLVWTRVYRVKNDTRGLLSAVVGLMT